LHLALALGMEAMHLELPRHFPDGNYLFHL
jgi:hypothetical protein